MAEPASYLTLSPGTDVLGSDGERVGAVEHVLYDDSTDIFDGLVIDTRLGPGGHRFVDAEQVADLRANAVVLTLPAADARRLPEPGPNPNVLRHGGAEDSESPAERKLRRAWELISGKGPQK
jgi:Uncharacterized protein conserved in bacteria (DUF2171)